MFIARIELRIQPAHRDDFRLYAASEAVAARDLAGCREYTFCEDVAAPGRVLLYEEWTTREAFEAYKRSSVFTVSGERLGPMLAGPPRSAYYESQDLFESCEA